MVRNAVDAFVISWAQTRIDGKAHVPPSALVPGCSWRWVGEPVRVDGPASVMPLGTARLGCDGEAGSGQFDPLLEHGFVLTDGRREWRVALIEGRARILCLFDRLPPAPDTLLWVVAVDWAAPARFSRNLPPRGVICFTPGTRLRTARGEVNIEDIQEDDLVQTRDNGLQPVCWMGQRRVSGARLRAMPQLAPVRLRAGALDDEIPDAELLVSPDHRVVLRGARARALFNTDEVLVSARDLVNDRSIRREYGARDLAYVHLALPRHEVIFANGVASESFHPLSAGLETLEAEDRARLLSALPALEAGEAAYGDYARRMLSKAEVAILRADADLEPLVA